MLLIEITSEDLMKIVSTELFQKEVLELKQKKDQK